MCGRFWLADPERALKELFGIQPEQLPVGTDFYPGKKVLAVISGKEEPIARLLLWGLIPHWAKDPRLGSKCFNARAETMLTKPVFRDAARRRRCVIPATGFFEWEKLPSTRRKRPWAFLSRNQEPLAMAGLWDEWADRSGGGSVATCAVVTVKAKPPVSEVHDRMPLLLDKRQISEWLSPTLPFQTLKEIAENPPEVTLKKIQGEVILAQTTNQQR